MQPVHKLPRTLHAAQSPAAAEIQLPKQFRIAHIEQDNYRTRTFTLDGELDASPGQFVMAWLPRFDEKPFSLVDSSPITLMITAVGPFTRLVHSLKVGDSLWIRGAYGRGFRPTLGQKPDSAQSGKHIALVAGGYGVAPLYWLARTMLNNAVNVGNGISSLTAIIGARHSEDLLYADRFATLFDGQRRKETDGDDTGQEDTVRNDTVAVNTVAVNTGIDDTGIDDTDANRLVLTTDDGSRGLHGRVTHALAPLLAEDAVDAVFACGPDPMLAALGELCLAHNVPAQLSWEAYMRCGVGLCGSCEHGGQLLCLDGPVLPL